MGTALRGGRPSSEHGQTESRGAVVSVLLSKPCRSPALTAHQVRRGYCSARRESSISSCIRLVHTDGVVGVDCVIRGVACGFRTLPVRRKEEGGIYYSVVRQHVGSLLAVRVARTACTTSGTCLMRLRAVRVIVLLSACLYGTAGRTLTRPSEAGPVLAARTKVA